MELVDLGASKRDPVTNALLVQCKGAGKDTSDAPDFGDVAMFQCLGLTAAPYPADDNGGAQGIVEELEGIPALLGARDTRTAKILGNLEPGDTVCHSSGPQQAAQLQLKEKKRQAVLVSKDSRGDTVVVSIDGKNDKITITGFEKVLEISREQGIVISDGGAGIQIKDGLVSIWGTIVLGGRTPTLPVLAGASGPAGVATPGVFVGV